MILAGSGVRFSDGGDDVSKVFVFPEPEHNPTVSLQEHLVAAISFLIPTELDGPVMSVLDARSPAVLWAAVPKATITEDGEPFAGEDDVWADRTLAANAYRQVNPESKTRRV